jgi:hydrogenase expression/formation protein HypC
MCLAVPGKIVEITPPAPGAPGGAATVDFQGSRVEASLAVTPQAKVGDWVLVHAGFAIAILDEQEARETFESLNIALGEGKPESGL